MLLALLDCLFLLTFLKWYFRGIAKISFPWSSAMSTVIRLPLFSPASGIIIPWLKPLIILFLFGKFDGSGFSSGGYSVITSPPVCNILRNNPRFSFGYMWSNPEP